MGETGAATTDIIAEYQEMFMAFYAEYAWVVWVVVGCLILLMIAPGIMSFILHRRKGYFGGFFVGLIFGVLGVLYAAGLPDKKLREALTGSRLDNK